MPGIVHFNNKEFVVRYVGNHIVLSSEGKEYLCTLSYFPRNDQHEENNSRILLMAKQGRIFKLNFTLFEKDSSIRLLDIKHLKLEEIYESIKLFANYKFNMGNCIYFDLILKDGKVYIYDYSYSCISKMGFD